MPEKRLASHCFAPRNACFAPKSVFPCRICPTHGNGPLIRSGEMAHPPACGGRGGRDSLFFSPLAGEGCGSLAACCLAKLDEGGRQSATPAAPRPSPTATRQQAAKSALPLPQAGEGKGAAGESPDGDQPFARPTGRRALWPAPAGGIRAANCREVKGLRGTRNSRGSAPSPLRLGRSRAQVSLPLPQAGEGRGAYQHALQSWPFAASPARR